MKAPSLFRYKAIPTTKIYIILQIFALQVIRAHFDLVSSPLVHESYEYLLALQLIAQGNLEELSFTANA
jgi:hypothetical protein